MGGKKYPSSNSKGIFSVLSKEDELLWKTVTEDVRPLQSTETRSQQNPSSTIERETAQYSVRPVSLNQALTQDLSELHHGAAPNVDKQTNRRLIKGRKIIEARLDLHGRKQEEARADLISFIQRSYDAQHRCVLVITGKGLRLHSGEIGVLRRNVPRWLNEQPVRPLVLAFSHATPKDGGEGALYVLLKRKR